MMDELRLAGIVLKLFLMLGRFVPVSGATTAHLSARLELAGS